MALTWTLVVLGVGQVCGDPGEPRAPALCRRITGGRSLEGSPAAVGRDVGGECQGGENLV